MELAAKLDVNLVRRAVAQIEPLAVPEDDSALSIRLGADRCPPLVAALSKVTEAHEQPLDRLTAEFAGMSHAEKGAKPITKPSPIRCT